MMFKAFIKNDVVVVPVLEVHASHACNLKCLSCSHYSYSTFKKHATLDDFENQFNNWSKKIKPSIFRVLGGEPFLNKQLDKFLFLIKKYFKSSKIVLVTNGLLIKKFEIDLEFIKKNNVFLVVSLHSNHQEYKQTLNESIDYLKKNNVAYSIVDSIKKWRLAHKVINNTITPFYDNDKRKSWECCPAKNCKQLYENKIYKCPQTTYLKIVTKYKVHEDFDIMLKYKPLEIDSTLEEIKNFWNLEEEDICSLCPAKHKYIKKGNPMKDHNNCPIFL
jgi:uncharacterized Fe-S cluster-containing radical SAM superfamily protein